MSQSLEFRAGNLRAQAGVTAQPHAHGTLEIIFDGAPYAFGRGELCLASWMACLEHLLSLVLHTDHSRDPVTFWIEGQHDLPALEAVRMHDTVRVAGLKDGEGDSTVCETRELRTAVEALRREIAAVEAAWARAGNNTKEIQVERACGSFRVMQGGGTLGSTVREVWPHAAESGARDAGQTPPVICMRVADMAGGPVEGSTRGQCGACGAEVWISPAAVRAISVQGNPVFCLHCYSNAASA
jgi:hypothetical protein